MLKVIDAAAEESEIKKTVDDLSVKVDHLITLLERYSGQVENRRAATVHIPLHRSYDAESVGVRAAKRGLRVGGNRILRLECLADSTPI